MKKLVLILAIALCAVMSATAQRSQKSKPDLESIKNATLDPTSRYYYPNLLKNFLSNDTLMNADDYKYFYYGTMFQEDYNPYRPNPFKDELDKMDPTYKKTMNLSRNELRNIETFAKKSLANNPLDLLQLNYLVYSYEKANKVNLAKIWRNKFNNLLMTISNSGDGTTPENAFVVVYPDNEIDFFNVLGGTVEDTEYIEPYYEKVTVRNRKGDKHSTYYFDLHNLLEQYYLKHPDDQQ